MNIYEAIEAVIEDTGELDPNIVAEKVSADYPSKQIRTALRALLPQAVLQVLKQHKYLSVEDAETIADSAPKGNESLRWKQVSKDRANFIIHGPDGAVRLGEATAEVLVWVAERHDRLAVGNQRSAEMCRSLVKALETFKVSRVDDLPADVVSRSWSR